MATKSVVASPIPTEFAVADINRLLFDLNSAFNPLHPGCQVNFQVSTVKDGYVFLSVALPEGMTRAYVTLLESLNGMIRCMDVKSRAVAAQVKVHDIQEREDIEARMEAHKAKVVLRYEGYLADGCDQAEAIRRTNASLKCEKHPWASYDLTKQILREAGKFRKRPKKGP
jgi:hypothetical protein